MTGSGDPRLARTASRSRAADRRRQIVAFALGALAVLFAVLNLDEVDVHWIVGTWQTPLIVVVAVSLLIGAGIGYMLARRRA
jgi:uncharacterized integral membrane protein